MSDLYDIVMKLNGPVTAVGDSGVDETRYENLECLITLTDKPIYEIWEASKSAGRVEASMSKIGKRADKFLVEVKEAYE